ncbi:MAG: 4Fe-4S binding protein [Bacteroidia bacterium]
MKYIQKAGLGVFIAALFAFISVLFLGNYEVTDAGLAQLSPQIKESHREMFLEELAQLKGRKFDSKFSFLGAVSSVIQLTNERVKQQYGLSEETIEGFIAAAVKGDDRSQRVSQQSYDQAVALVGDNMRETVLAYTNWLVGQSAGSEAELRQKVSDALTGAINGYAGNFSVSEYDAQDYLFSMAKIMAGGIYWENQFLFFLLIIVAGTVGALVWIFPAFFDGLPGIKHNGIYHQSATSRGLVGILAGIFLVGFYILLYFKHAYIAEWISLADPVSGFLRNGAAADRWFMYGFLYTISILVMGIRMFAKYRHSNYHKIRTASVIFFQTAFAFLIPQVLHNLNLPEQDLKNMWPLDYSFFFDYRLNTFTSTQTGIWMMVWGIILLAIGVPVLTYFFGKRWYCSWVCGCGGLAETLGDPYRQLSSKKLVSWQIERYLIHGVLVFVVAMTGMVLYTYFTGQSTILGFNSYSVRGMYGFAIGSIFAGVIGTGFYPLMGNRVWCRFGCPLAAYLGIVQRFKSRFRITTNGGQCISCGNCSTYCEMGIDVRAYAQRGQNIVRSSCVGCGVCAAVCPRGVLALENGDNDNSSRMSEVLY